MKLVFASQNKNKVKEIAALMPASIELIGLAELNFKEDIEEYGKTFQENSLIKAKFIHNRYQVNCFADDSGLEVLALNNEPGVYSARYAGNEKNDDANMNKLLDNLSSQANKKARFRTAIALILDGKEYFFEGEVAGRIIEEKRGENGFGYDPIFVPDGYDKTFAELSSEEKNIISHRAKAMQKLITFLSDK